MAERRPKCLLCRGEKFVVPIHNKEFLALSVFVEECLKGDTSPICYFPIACWVCKRSQASERRVKS